jgi:uncharacterized RDD family membrane protein YckC
MPKTDLRGGGLHATTVFLIMGYMNGRRKQIDTSVEIVTPENISFRYWLAGPSRRLPAYLIDVLVQVSFLMLAGWGLGFAFGLFRLAGSFLGLFLVILFLVHWCYGALLESLWNGQTLGKRAMHIRVVAVHGQPIRVWQAVLRNVLRAVDAMPLLPLVYGSADAALPLFAVGLIAASLNDRFQRLGDMAAGTMVVVEQPARLSSVLKFRDQRVMQMAAAIPPGFQVNRTLGLALSLYVQRRKVLPRARRQEIARHLGDPLCQRFNLPAGTDCDLLLCGLYQQAFLGSSALETAAIP